MTLAHAPVHHAPALTGLLPAATGPAAQRGLERLLLVDATRDSFHHMGIGDLPGVLRPGDLLVLNDAATLPASIQAHTPRGQSVELRLAARLGPGRHRVALFGAGDWRTPTEERSPPPELVVGELLTASPKLHLRVEALAPGGRFAELSFVERGPGLLAELYRVGRPIQYSYLQDDLPLRSFQTAYATRPWASEMPSAGRPLSWRGLLGLRRAGVGLARLTHAAGLSSIDGGELDATLPWPERYEIPVETVLNVERTQAAGGRVVAAGTTVVRALEGNVQEHGRLVAGGGVTELVLGPGADLQVVDGLLSTLHEPGESHFELLSAFADPGLLQRANASAAEQGYRAHEFGDAMLILPDGGAI